MLTCVLDRCTLLLEQTMAIKLPRSITREQQSHWFKRSKDAEGKLPWQGWAQQPGLAGPPLCPGRPAHPPCPGLTA